MSIVGVVCAAIGTNLAMELVLVVRVFVVAEVTLVVLVVVVVSVGMIDFLGLGMVGKSF